MQDIVAVILAILHTLASNARANDTSPAASKRSGSCLITVVGLATVFACLSLFMPGTPLFPGLLLLGALALALLLVSAWPGLRAGRLIYSGVFPGAAGGLLALFTELYLFYLSQPPGVTPGVWLSSFQESLLFMAVLSLGVGAVLGPFGAVELEHLALRYRLPPSWRPLLMALGAASLGAATVVLLNVIVLLVRPR